MKNTPLLLAFVAMTVGFVVFVAMEGCTTTSAYQTIAASETAVLKANSAYLDGVVSGVIPTNNVPQVEAAFNDTQLALHAAASVASGGMNAPVPAAVAVKVMNFTNSAALPKK